MNEEHSELREECRRVVREFCEREVTVGAVVRERTGTFLADLVKRLGELGAMGITTPASHGGLGMDGETQFVVIEEVAAADAALASIYTAHLLALEALTFFAIEQQVGLFVRPLASFVSRGGQAVNFVGQRFALPATRRLPLHRAPRSARTQRVLSEVAGVSLDQLATMRERSAFAVASRSIRENDEGDSCRSMTEH